MNHLAEPVVVAVTVVEAKVRIGGTLYEIHRNEHKTFVEARIRKLEGDRAGTVYEVRRYRDGRVVCPCLDASCRKRTCRHVAALERIGFFERTNDGES